MMFCKEKKVMWEGVMLPPSTHLKANNNSQNNIILPLQSSTREAITTKILFTCKHCPLPGHIHNFLVPWTLSNHYFFLTKYGLASTPPHFNIVHECIGPQKCILKKCWASKVQYLGPQRFLLAQLYFRQVISVRI